MRGQPGRRLLVEVGQRSGIAARMVRRPSSDGIAQFLLDGTRGDQVGRDGPRVGLFVDARVVGDDVGLRR